MTTTKYLVKVRVIGIFVLVCLWVFARSTRSVQAQGPQDRPSEVASYPPPVTPAEFDHWMKYLSNWGRWGKDDQIGAVNLITPSKRKQALSLVREGISLSLEHPLLEDKTIDNGAPFERELSLSSTAGPGGMVSGATDRYSVAYHGRAHSHMDALCHVFYKGQLYNGFSYQEVNKEHGCEKNGIQNLQNGIITRGILIDIPRLKGVPYLDPGAAVYPADIEAWEKKVGVKVGSGDAILLRTGRWARRAKFGPYTNLSGYHATVAPWFKARDIALVASDGVQDVGSVPGIGLTVHIFVIAGLGAIILDNLDLEAVAETAARLHRWEFALTIAPLTVERGTGSPVNPIATF